jgi:hypothetical protein
VARDRPSAGRLTLCGDDDDDDGDDDPDGMVRITTAAQAPSTTAAMAPSTASERHLVILTCTQ